MIETNISASPGNPPNSPASSHETLVAPMPHITLYFVQSSPAIRIAWLLEELGLPYEVVFFYREEAEEDPEAFKASKSFYFLVSTFGQANSAFYNSQRRQHGQSARPQCR